MDFNPSRISTGINAILNCLSPNAIFPTTISPFRRRIPIGIRIFPFFRRNPYHLHQSVPQSASFPSHICFNLYYLHEHILCGFNALCTAFFPIKNLTISRPSPPLSLPPPARSPPCTSDRIDRIYRIY